MAGPLEYLRAVLDDRELDIYERVVALAVMRHGAERSHPGARLLAAETGMSEKKVRTTCQRLVDKKWLVQTCSGRGGGHNRANEYAIHIPNGTGYRLDESQTVPGDSQTVPEVIPNGTGYLTNAFRNAFRNTTDVVDDPQARAKQRLETRLRLAKNDNDRTKAQQAYDTTIGAIK